MFSIVLRHRDVSHANPIQNVVIKVAIRNDDIIPYVSLGKMTTNKSSIALFQANA